MYFFFSAGLIACKDVGIYEAFSCPWRPSPTFYKLLEIERLALPGLAMAHNVGPVTVRTVQDLENHDATRSRWR